MSGVEHKELQISKIIGKVTDSRNCTIFLFRLRVTVEIIVVDIRTTRTIGIINDVIIRLIEGITNNTVEGTVDGTNSVYACLITNYIEQGRVTGTITTFLFNGGKSMLEYKQNYRMGVMPSRIILISI